MGRGRGKTWKKTADEKDEGELPVQGVNEDEDEDDRDENAKAEICKVTNCPIQASRS